MFWPFAVVQYERKRDHSAVNLEWGFRIIDEPDSGALVISKAALWLFNENRCPMDPSTKKSGSSALTPSERILILSSLLGLIFGLFWAFYTGISLWSLISRGLTGLFCGQGLGCLLLELKKH